jgi:hypothetical protein
MNEATRIRGPFQLVLPEFRIREIHTEGCQWHPERASASRITALRTETEQRSVERATPTAALRNMPHIPSFTTAEQRLSRLPSRRRKRTRELRVPAIRNSGAYVVAATSNRNSLRLEVNVNHRKQSPPPRSNRRYVSIFAACGQPQSTPRRINPSSKLTESTMISNRLAPRLEIAVTPSKQTPATFLIGSFSTVLNRAIHTETEQCSVEPVFPAAHAALTKAVAFGRCMRRSAPPRAPRTYPMGV